MSQEIETRLPDSVRAQIRSPNPELYAVVLVTVDPTGFPHVALLSFFELMEHDGSLYLWIHAQSRSARFLSARRRCTLIVAGPAGVYYIKADTEYVTDFRSQGVFRARIASVLQDFPAPGEGEAALEEGLRFSLDSSQREARIRFKWELEQHLRRQETE